MAADWGIITASLRELAEGLDDALAEQTMEVEEMDLMATAELEQLLEQEEPEPTDATEGKPVEGSA
jgi:hypothetical protein